VATKNFRVKLKSKISNQGKRKGDSKLIVKKRKINLQKVTSVEGQRKSNKKVIFTLRPFKRKFKVAKSLAEASHREKSCTKKHI